MELEWEIVHNGGKKPNDSSYHMILREKTFDVFQECVLSEGVIDICYFTNTSPMMSWDTEASLIKDLQAGQVARRVA